MAHKSSKNWENNKNWLFLAKNAEIWCFFKSVVPKNGFFSAEGRKNLKVLFLHPMAGSKMVHGGGRFFWSMGDRPPICPCMFHYRLTNFVWIISSLPLLFHHNNHLKRASRIFIKHWQFFFQKLFSHQMFYSQSTM